MRYRPTLLLALVVSVAPSVIPSADLRAQTPYERTFVGLYFGAQAYDLESLNGDLTAQGFPEFSDWAVRFGFEVDSRTAGRHVFGARSYYDALSRTDASRRSSRSAKMRSFGVEYSYGFDLLHPSAWNLLIGADFGPSLGAVTTFTSDDRRGGAPDFAQADTKATFVFGMLTATPMLTLQSVEFGGDNSTSRVNLRVGYRFGTKAPLSRRGFEDETFDTAVRPGGLHIMLSATSLLRRQHEAERGR